ncbi:prolipoprotein diacylglyceryl transferase [Panacibacter sp. DH6]|uniref:Prolipoprotein diacylglyceryl transferase n=1 Tax=Panacibacter microcysteis TaxID=2793269 RepID=A0A931H013_9BACT|nr:prolipoprotein diacylglyceryl transferase family protein [Panacibacter microcysteis]MBG9378524.1 prolipoprotein diacylglyceryl transferase [Panacibacter microcysteis]
MYPNLYYFFNEAFDVSIPVLRHINTAGFFIALCFFPAAWIWKKCMIEKEGKGLLLPVKRVLYKGSAHPVTYYAYPHETTEPVIIIAAVTGIIGSKISGALEEPALFLQDALGELLSTSGFSFYGGLVLASVVIWFYYQRRGMRPLIIADCMTPAFMIAYGVGRLGCHFSGDGDWGVTNFNAKPVSWLPGWAWAYRYPHNTLREGVYIPGCTWDDYCNQLGAPVYPTSLYEAVVCITLCFVLYSMRNRFKYAGQLWAVYLVLNGIERFLIEQIRINSHYNILGIAVTQGEMFALLFVATGLILFYSIPAYKKHIDYAALSGSRLQHPVTDSRNNQTDSADINE